MAKQLYDAHNRAIGKPVFMNFFRDWRKYWDGFDERNSSRLPTTEEKQKMIMYPICISVIQHKVLPLLAPHITLDGDEKQVAVMKHWFDRHYRRCTKLMYQKSHTWGFSVGERVIEVEKIDGVPYWMHVGSFMPEPFNTELVLGEDKPEIVGFKYHNFRVDRYQDNGEWMMPGMVYMHCEGDEVSKPYGDSILNKMFWAWQLVMKTWTSLVVYQRLQSPFIKYFYSPEMYGDTDNKATDQGRTQATNDLLNIKNTQGVAIPLVEDKDGKLVRGPDLDVTAPPNKETTYNETIRILNSLMYVANNFPERLSEQFKESGSQSMVEVQGDYYTEYILPDDIEHAENQCRIWFTDPMMEVNFDKIDCTYKFTVSDKQREYYVKLLQQLIQSGQTIGELDTRAIAEGAGVPVTELSQPTVETTERKVMVPGMEFASKRGDDKKRVKAWEEQVAQHVRKSNEQIKLELYQIIRKRIDEQHGRMVPKINNLYKKGTPKRVDLQKAIQLPDRIYEGAFQYILQAWDACQKFHCQHTKPKPIKPMANPTRKTMEELRTIDDRFCGSQYITGEGEKLEGMLYDTMTNVGPENALKTFDQEFEYYKNTTLPIRIANIIHRASMFGVKDFVLHLELTRAKEQREGK